MLMTDEESYELLKAFGMPFANSKKLIIYGKRISKSQREKKRKD